MTKPTLESLRSTTKLGMVKMDDLHRRWWNQYMDRFDRYGGAVCNDWEQDFMRQMQANRENHLWQPTLKQWNLVKQISEKCT
jgi:hypothetical protein